MFKELYLCVDFSSFNIKNVYTNEKINLEYLSEEIGLPEKYRKVYLAHTNSWNSNAMAYELISGHPFLLNHISSKNKETKMRNVVMSSTNDMLAKSINFRAILKNTGLEETLEFYDSLIKDRYYDKYCFLIRNSLTSLYSEYNDLKGLSSELVDLFESQKNHQLNLRKK